MVGHYGQVRRVTYLSGMTYDLDAAVALEPEVNVGVQPFVFLLDLSERYDEAAGVEN
jgi:hypothetical protein